MKTRTSMMVIHGADDQVFLLDRMEEMEKEEVWEREGRSQGERGWKPERERERGG